MFFLILASCPSGQLGSVCFALSPDALTCRAWIQGGAVCLLWMQGLAFVGSEVITFNAVTNSGLQAEWLAALLQVKLHSMPCILNPT
jgi:hypothetical protein